MDPKLSEELKKIIDEYTQLHDAQKLSEGVPEELKNKCISLLDARIDELVAGADFGTDEYNKCTLISAALKNGWLVSDIGMLLSVYDAVKSLAYGSRERLDGEEILSQLEHRATDTVADRFGMLKILSFYMIGQNTKSPEAGKSYKLINSNYHPRIVYATEYPKDSGFKAYAIDDEGQMRTSYVALFQNPAKYSLFEEQRDKKARESDSYVMGMDADEERIQKRKEGFVQNPGQKYNNIKKSNRDVISEVFGSDVYDEIDEMRRGSAQERTVPLYHSTGTKYMKQGHEVLQIEIAGSGAQDVVKNHKGHDGEIRKIADPELYKKTYGQKVENFDFIHVKEREYKVNDDLTVQKKRYAIAGASPDMGIITGLFNLGDYSIESTKVNARKFAKEFIEPLFKRFKEGEEPRDINIMLSGHSRGAVAAGQSVKEINEWLQKYITDNPEYKPFADHIKYDLVLYDPVPGAITDIHLGSCNLRGIKNVNTTVICTMAQNHYDMLLPLQHIKGAKKIVLTTTDHLMDKWKVDETQVNVAGDGKKHSLSYYDAETGEMYRGSGICQMPDGVYIADEDKNMVRVTSYSQLSKIFKTLYGKETPQRIRCNNIHKMVRDWFVENSLEMSFPDKETRLELTEKNKDTQDRILDSPNKRLIPVKLEIEKLRKMQKAGKPADKIIVQQKEVIRVCREYMKKTRIPATGDSLYRVDLVSDLLSFTMRQTNELEKQVSAEKGVNIENDLDNRIAKHKNRLNEKEGYAARKLYFENARLRDEVDILEKVRSTAKLCEEKLKILDKTRVGKINSTEYDDLHDVLVKGAGLGERSSVNEITDFYRHLVRVSDQYIFYHDTLLGPITGDGQTRLKFSKDFSEHAKKVGKEVIDKSIHLRDKDMSMEKRILKRRESVAELNIKTAAQREHSKAVRTQKIENAKKKESLKV